MDWKTHGVKIVRPDAFDANTPQTPGMTRTAAITRARKAIRRQRSAFRTGPRGDRARPSEAVAVAGPSPEGMWEAGASAVTRRLTFVLV